MILRVRSALILSAFMFLCVILWRWRARSNLISRHFTALWSFFNLTEHARVDPGSYSQCAPYLCVRLCTFILDDADAVLDARKLSELGCQQCHVA